MIETKIICCRRDSLRKLGYKDFENWIIDDNHIYIGRRNVYVKGTYQSKWHNPFSVKKYGREGCMAKYKEYIMKDKKLLGQIEELRGKILGCWCKPEKCHGDVLLELLNEKK